MSAGFSARRGIALYLLVWMMLALLFAALMTATLGASWIRAFLFAVPATMVYAVAAGFSSYYLCRAYPLADKRPVAIVSVFLVSAMFAAAFWTSFCLVWDNMWLALELDWAGLGMAPQMRAIIFSLGVILYGLAAVAHYLAIEFERARAAERRGFTAALAAQEAELRMLRSQIDPHFLFNSLNSISALTSIDAARARAMTLQLADFFRHSLSLEAHQRVTLADEAMLATRFLAIEQVRFGARLVVHQEISADAAACLLPPMILQPLVENAVKHGIGSLPGGGAIHIRGWRAGSVLHVVVENDVDPDAGGSGTLGIGLENVRLRLTASYAHEASVHAGRDDNRFRVALQLPADTGEFACA